MQSTKKHLLLSREATLISNAYAIPTPSAPTLAVAPNDRFVRRRHPELFGPQPTKAAQLPAARQWAMQLVNAIVEVIDGVRPHTQLVRWLAPDVLNSVLEQRKIRAPERMHVRSIYVFETGDGIAEVSGVFGTRARCFALAMRLEGLDGRWKVTDLSWGG